MIGTTMKGVKRCIELHKFSVSQGYGRAEAQHDFLLQHVAMPDDLSMDVRAVANLMEAISGYMEDLHAARTTQNTVGRRDPRECPLHSNGVVQHAQEFFTLRGAETTCNPQ